MSYNAKLLKYKNGMVEFRVYSDLVGADTSTKRRKPHEEYNPFLDEVVKMRRIYDRETEEYKALRSKNNSYKRTVDKIYSFSRQCNWEFFITLTFDSDKVNRYDYDACMAKAKKWFNNQRNRYAPDLQYLCVPEMHKDGAWHIHGLVANVGSMDIGNVSRVITKRQLPSGKWITLKQPLELLSVGGWKNGYSDASRVHDVQKVSSYIVKYITKELCDLTSGKHRYFRSNNIPEVETQTFIDWQACNDDFITTLADSLGMEAGYRKTCKSEHLTATYIFFNDKGEIET